MSRRGWTVIELIVVLAILGLLVALIAPAVLAARRQAAQVQCTNHLRQIGLAEHQFVEAHGHFPTSADGSHDLNTILTIGLQRLLPMLENAEDVFGCPADPRVNEAHPFGPRSYWQNDGLRFRSHSRNGFNSDRDGEPGPPFHDTRPSEITDGLSNTAIVSEQLIAGTNDHWLSESQLRADGRRYLWFTDVTFADEIALAADCEAHRQTPFPFAGNVSMFLRWGYDHILPPNHVGCINGPYDGVDPFNADRRAAFPASSLHHGSVNVLLGDGAVRRVADHIDLTAWRALGTRAGNESMSESW